MSRTKEKNLHLGHSRNLVNSLSCSDTVMETSDTTVQKWADDLAVAETGLLHDHKLGWLETVLLCA